MSLLVAQEPLKRSDNVCESVLKSNKISTATKPKFLNTNLVAIWAILSRGVREKSVTR